MKQYTVVALPLLLAACVTNHNPSAPSRYSVAGAWISDVRGVRLQLQVTEQASSEVVLFELSGGGALTIPATGDIQRLRIGGFLITPGTVLMNFFSEEMTDNSYGQFNGHADGVTLTGTIRNDFSRAVGPFGPEPVPVVFRRP